MRSWGLKPRLLLVTLAIFMATGIISFALFLASSRSLGETLGIRFAESKVLLAKSRILGEIDREAALARKMADSPLLKSWIADEANSGKRRLADAELESYRRAFRDGNYFVAIASSDHYYNQPAQGPLTLATLNPRLSSDRWFFDSLGSVGDYVLNLDYNPYIRATKVWINCAVHDGPANLGFAGTGLDLSGLVSDLTAQRQGDLSFMLLDARGNITAHPDSAIMERNARSWSSGGAKLNAADLATNPTDRAAVLRLLGSLSGSPDEVKSARLSLGGPPALVAASYLPGIDWIILASVDLRSLLDLRSLAKVPLVFIVALVLSLLSLALFAERFVLVPLSALSRAAGEVAKGSYDLALPGTGIGEIGALATSFGLMAAEVRSFTEDLERRVEQRTRELAEANRQMLEDLRYADIVQRSILPRSELLDRCLPQRFVLFRPRERVGGDFYFFREKPEGFIIGVADCTGHGVSGALMTMFTEAALESILGSPEARDPAEVIDELRRRLRSGLDAELHGLAGERGVDIALCDVSIAASTLVFAGSGVELFVESGGEVERIRSPRRQAAPVRRSFPLSGQAFYLCTDGFLDQAGGDAGFGFGGTGFAALAGEIAAVPWPERLLRFETALDVWKGQSPQRDDITVVAFAATPEVGA